MYKGNIHAPKHAKLIYENATAPVFSLISNGGFSWNLNIGAGNKKGDYSMLTLAYRVVRSSML